MVLRTYVTCKHPWRTRLPISSDIIKRLTNILDGKANCIIWKSTEINSKLNSLLIVWLIFQTLKLMNPFSYLSSSKVIQIFQQFTEYLQSKKAINFRLCENICSLIFFFYCVLEPTSKFLSNCLQSRITQVYYSFLSDTGKSQRQHHLQSSFSPTYFIVNLRRSTQQNTSTTSIGSSPSKTLHKPCCYQTTEFQHLHKRSYTRIS